MILHRDGGNVTEMSRFLNALGTGYMAGFLAVRLADAVRDLRNPAPPLEPDPKRYGRARRAFALGGIARTFAELTVARVLAPPIARLCKTGRPTLDAAVVWAVLGLAGAAVELPTAYVEEFVTERRYGTSTQSAGAWFSEYVRGRAIELPVGAALFALGFAGVRRFPKRWPLVGGAALAPLAIVANLVVPLAIAPLFNRFTPIEGRIAERLRALAERYDVGDAALLRVDMSRQTNKVNAYVTGLLGTHRIVVADTLLDGFADDEVEFVVAHELGHYLFGDVWRSVAVITAVGTAALLTAARGSGTIDDAPAFLRVLGRAFVAALVAGPLIAGYSRGAERRADTFAISATGDGAAGARAFTRLRERNLAEDEQPWWWEALFASHPSLRSRIARLESKTT